MMRKTNVEIKRKKTGWKIARDLQRLGGRERLTEVGTKRKDI